MRLLLTIVLVAAVASACAQELHFGDEEQIDRRQTELVWSLAADGIPDSTVQSPDGTRREAPSQEWRQAYRELHGKAWVPKALPSRQDLIRAQIKLLERQIAALEAELVALGGPQLTRLP